MTDGDPYPFLLEPPDLSIHRQGNVGIDYVWRFESGRAGPNVLVTALVHGNELCGAIAVDALLRDGVRPIAGVLTLAFCDVAAFASFDRARPGAARYVDEDFNRLWSRETLRGPRRSVELARARELAPIVAAADRLLDIHSMQHATAPLVLCGPYAKGRAFAHAVGHPATIVADHGHAAGPRMRDYGAFGDPQAEANALLVECGQHGAPSSAEVASAYLYRFLDRCGVLADDIAERHGARAPAAPARVVEVTGAVTIASDRFTFAADYRGFEVIPRKGTIIGHDGRTPVPTPYDDCVLIMPSLRVTRGQTAVRLGRYVD
jgi:predicted deacylase